MQMDDQELIDRARQDIGRKYHAYCRAVQMWARSTRLASPASLA